MCGRELSDVRIFHFSSNGLCGAWRCSEACTFWHAFMHPSSTPTRRLAEVSATLCTRAMVENLYRWVCRSSVSRRQMSLRYCGMWYCVVWVSSALAQSLLCGWSVYRLELDCLKSNFADRARNEFEGLFSRPVVTFWKEARSSSASQHCFLSRWGFYISKVPGLRT